MLACCVPAFISRKTIHNIRISHFHKKPQTQKILCPNNMDIFHENIKTNTIQNENYRQVAYTGKHLQFVYMSIEPQDNIHLETHPHTDQFIRIEKGIGQAIVDGKTYELGDDIGIIIPAGTQHKILNISTTEKLKLYSIYAPPEHPQNTINETNPDNTKKPVETYERKYAKYKLKYLATKGK